MAVVILMRAIQDYEHMCLTAKGEDMSMNIPIPNRARKYGYVIWHKADDRGMHQLLKDTKRVEVVFEGELLGMKRIDWKGRRISVGYDQTRPLPEDITHYSLTRSKDGRLKVSCVSLTGP